MSRPSVSRLMSLLLLLALLHLSVGCGPSGGTMHQVWDAASSAKPVSDRFCYLLFPKPGTALAVDRAVICSQEELTSSTGTLSAFDEKNIEHTIPLAALTPEPDAASLARHLQNLNQILQKWGEETDWKSVRFEHAPSPDGTIIYTLSIQVKKGDTMRYDYRIEHGQPKALRQWISRRR